MKPTLEHGTTGRGRGSSSFPKDNPNYRPPCHCEPCRNAMNTYKKKLRLSVHRGESRIVSADRSRQHLIRLRDAGMGCLQLASATGFSGSTVRKILSGARTEVLASTERKILSARPADGPRARGIYMDPTGAARRVQALQAIGHAIPTIAAAAGLSTRCLEALLGTRPSRAVRLVAADGIAQAYRSLAGTPGTSKKSRTIAAARSWAPPSAWDDEAIDDPASAPEWTGHCGSIRGWHKHHLASLPMCERCTQANERWQSEHAHLTPYRRARKAHSERMRASGRSVQLAEDWEELRAQGYSLKRAAERLGVKRETLEVALSRAKEYDRAA